ncbi:MAG: YciI family protein [Gammaproteobacteria bacterium]|nr:YciI family protein [Gammaproteobacteria bacterium]
MHYMLLIYSDETCWSEDEYDQCIVESLAICEELATQGKLLGASPLRPVSTATSLRMREGRRQVMDGPFAETTEQLGGYYLLDVSDLDEALAIASRLPPASKGTIEIRPLQPLPQNQEVPTAAHFPVLGGNHHP